MTIKTKSSKITTSQALELYRTADQPGNSRAFLTALLEKSRTYERTALQQGAVDDADVYRANARAVEALIDGAAGGES